MPTGNIYAYCFGAVTEVDVPAATGALAAAGGAPEAS